ncbi:MAG: hypothetical protein JNL02_10535 [Saprospiraceae bacterium]|nr:hypothetical protein [Saprospiraceae bacterium]
MYRSFFQRFFSVALLAALFSLNACQKDVDLTPTEANPEGVAGERNQIFYGVSQFGGALVPSRVFEIDQNTGAINIAFSPTVNGTGAAITDIRGICYLGSGIKYAIMTGPNNGPGVPNNSLMTLNVNTQEAFFVSTSTLVGVVSDIDYDPLTGNIYGLRGNDLVIIDGPSGLQNYNAVAIQGLPAGHTVRGLTMIGDVNVGTQINIASTSAGFGATTQMRKVDPNTGVTGFIATLLPGNQLNGGNCGLSYQLTPNSDLFINRNGTGIAGFGLNNTAWPNQGNVGTAVWGAAGVNFDDLSSDVGQ